MESQDEKPKTSRSLHFLTLWESSGFSYPLVEARCGPQYLGERWPFYNKLGSAPPKWEIDKCNRLHK